MLYTNYNVKICTRVGVIVFLLLLLLSYNLHQFPCYSVHSEIRWLNETIRGYKTILVDLKLNTIVLYL